MTETSKPAEAGTPEVVEAAPETKTLTVTGGEGLAVLTGGLAGLPQLSKDMPIEERRDAVRTVLKKTIDMPDRMDVFTGEMLYEVHSNEYWRDYVGEFGGDTRPYTSFDEYAEHELGIKRRKAYYLIKIYSKFVVELGLSPEILSGLEWSKAKEVVDVIDADNWVEILDKLKSMSVAEIKAMVREMKGVTSDGDSEPSDTVKRTYVLHEGQAETVDAAVALARTMTGSDKDGFALEMVCSDFLTSSAGSGLEGALSKLDVAVKTIESAFGVKLSIESVDVDRYETLKGETETATKAEEPETKAEEPAPAPEPEVVAAKS